MIEQSNLFLYNLSQSLPPRMFFQRPGCPGLCGFLFFYLYFFAVIVVLKYFDSA